MYDIAQHLQYEAGRGVRYLSTMERALGGEAEFASQSPSVILAQAGGRGRETRTEDSAVADRCVAVLCCAATCRWNVNVVILRRPEVLVRAW